jgi:hypothetical protein
MTVHKEWTLEQAQAAQRAFEADGGSSSDPTGPLFRWDALQTLEEIRTRYENGDDYALMLAIRMCANHDLVMPEWVAKAYIRAFDTVNGYRAKSWDDVFGHPLPKNAQLAALRKKRMKAAKVWTEVNKRHKAGAPIDDLLFASVGKKLGLGVTLTKEYYAAWARRIEAGLPPVVQALLANVVKPDHDKE